MKSESQLLVMALLLITVGTGWLLTTLEVLPDIDWVWTLILAMVGLLSLVLAGLDKVSVVVGPFFLLASGLSILRQTGHLQFDVEIPILLTLAGLLLLIARLPALSLPIWLREDSTPANRNTGG